jgi:hypothetical protein
LITKHLVAVSNQPLVQLTGALSVLTGITEEDPGHHHPSSRR